MAEGTTPPVAVSPAAGPTPTRYRCVGVWATWVLGFNALFFLLLRYGWSPNFAGDGFLAGLGNRFFDDAYYGFLGFSFLGSLAYGLCLLAATETRGARSRSLFRLVGVRLTSDGERAAFLASAGTHVVRAPLRDAATLFPGLGFLGTVIGISIAIGGLEAVMNGQAPSELISGLRTAFDTTFLGLVASLVLTLLLMVQDQAMARQLPRTGA